MNDFPSFSLPSFVKLSDFVILYRTIRNGFYMSHTPNQAEPVKQQDHGRSKCVLRISSPSSLMQ